ncbi:MAG: uroporphyrinogen-III C-methyltransferase [Aestuariibacter sp.]
MSSISLSNGLASVMALFRKFDGLTKRKIDLSSWWNSSANTNERSANGKVYIIGAGPGDPELLTMKAHRLLQNADVVLFDWLVSEELLNLAPRNAIRQFVGKRCGQHSCPQEMICNLMVQHASFGRNVVRLKGGDPSVFGRVSEECQALQAADIPFAIVPGITAATGMAAYTGMPLTDRRFAQSVRLITASLKHPDAEPEWQNMVAQDAQKQDTLVFYMGLKKVSKIVARLRQHNMPPDTAIALVDQACLPTQQVLSGTLANIEQRLLEANLAGPALIIVGETARQSFSVAAELLSHQHTTIR